MSLCYCSPTIYLGILSNIFCLTVNPDAFHDRYIIMIRDTHGRGRWPIPELVFFSKCVIIPYDKKDI